MQKYLKSLKPLDRFALTGIVAIGIWFIGAIVLSISVNLDFEAWESWALARGHASFREWGEPFFWRSLIATPIFWGILWGMVEVTYKLLPHHHRSRYRRSR